MPSTQSEQFRRRARRMRDLAARIESSPVMSLDRRADDETWRGDRPRHCVDLLRSDQANLHVAAESLRWQAYLFDQRAMELERLAALVAPPPPLSDQHQHGRVS